MKIQTKLLLVLTAIILANTASAGHVCPIQGCYPTQSIQSAVGNPEIREGGATMGLSRLLARVRYIINMVRQRIRPKLNDPGNASITPSVFDPGLQRDPKVVFPIDPNVLPIINPHQH